MTKAALVTSVAESLGQTKKATAETLSEAFALIAYQVHTHGRFSWPGFGTWTLRQRKARQIRNPQTNQLMQLPATKTIGFRPAAEVKARL